MKKVFRMKNQKFGIVKKYQPAHIYTLDLLSNYDVGITFSERLFGSKICRNLSCADILIA